MESSAPHLMRSQEEAMSTCILKKPAKILQRAKLRRASLEDWIMDFQHPGFQGVESDGGEAVKK